MSYDFKVLGQVDSVEEFPEGASVLIESQGNIKRCAADGLGGGGYVLEVPVEDFAAMNDWSMIPVDDEVLAEAMDAYKSGSNVVVHLAIPTNELMGGQPMALADEGTEIELPEEVHGYFPVNFMLETVFDYVALAGGNLVNIEVMDLSEFTGPFGKFKLRWLDIELLTKSDCDYIMSFYNDEYES